MPSGERILANRFYRNISDALSGTQEYMAAEKLYELHAATSFDLIVVDTPPTRNALDVLDAPNQLARLLDHRVYRILTAPGRGVGRVVNRAAQTVRAPPAPGRWAPRSSTTRWPSSPPSTAWSRASGSAPSGCRRCSARRRPPSSWWPRPGPTRSARRSHFARRLEEQGLAVRALVVNRMHPPFGGMPAAPGPGPGGRRRAAPTSPLGALWSNLADFRAVAEREEETLAGLAARVAPAPVVRVPLLDDDVHDLDGLALVASPPARPAGR